MNRSSRFRSAIDGGCEGIKPGWVRVNFNYFISEAVFQYIVGAVDLVAAEGWKLLPYYRFSVDTGLWRHRDHQPGSQLGLDQLSFEGGRLDYDSKQLSVGEEALPGYLDQAHQIIAEAERRFDGDAARPALPEDLERLRWFPLPENPFIDLA
jgi:hypothetical protein